MLLANESPFVLISQSSVDTVNLWIVLNKNGNNHLESGDLMISLQPSFASRTHHPPPGTLSSTSDTLPPFHEDSLDFIRIGTQTFQVLAQCRRCPMICVDQKTGERMKEPFCSLARHRRNGMRRIEFGVHLVWHPSLAV
jgi:molybdenum cofactor sulfurtransferase